MITAYKCLECRDVYPHGAACDCDPSAVAPEPRITPAMVRRLRRRSVALFKKLQPHMFGMAGVVNGNVIRIIEEWATAENRRAK